jgi:hypothetical protein
MPNLFKKLGLLAEIGEHLGDVVEIIRKFKAAKKAVAAAHSGDVVDGGWVKGIKIGGKVVDLPLPLHVR